MNPPSYLAAYQSAFRRWAEGCKDDQWEEWLEELAKIRAAWKWSVAGMLTQSDTNDPELWDALGDAFLGGRGVERDLAQAEQWYRRAAEAKYGRSMVSLGRLLGRAGRTPDELAESVHWFRRAADLGDTSGMTCLGFADREGTGVPVNEREAADWFIKAYAAGAKHAADLAGRALCGNRANHPESAKWLRIAVEEGNELSNYNLALIYEDRESPEHNAEEAFRCWSRLAERPKGNDVRFMAMLTLARCCRDGIGIKRDRQQAIQWLDRLMACAPPKAYCRDAAKLRKEIDEDLL